MVTSREWMTAWLSAPAAPPPGGCHACSVGERRSARRSSVGSAPSRSATVSDSRPKSPPAAAISAPNSSGVRRTGMVTWATTCRTCHASHSVAASQESAGPSASRSARSSYVVAVQSWRSCSPASCVVPLMGCLSCRAAGPWTVYTKTSVVGGVHRMALLSTRSWVSEELAGCRQSTSWNLCRQSRNTAADWGYRWDAGAPEKRYYSYMCSTRLLDAYGVPRPVLSKRWPARI